MKRDNAPEPEATAEPIPKRELMRETRRRRREKQLVQMQVYSPDDDEIREKIAAYVRSLGGEATVRPRRSK